MENIKHTNIPVNGISMHVAEIGEGPAVLFLHGFPELWYSWRHQMLFLASKGYRAIAPDLRGFGDTDAPGGGGASYTAFHVVGDLVALLKALELEKVFLVGHDWGASIAWYFCLFRPDLVNALVNLSVVFRQRNPAMKPVEMFRKFFGDDFYMCRFQAPGEAEEDFGKYDTAEVMKAFLTSRNPLPPIVPKEGFGAFIKKVPATLPDWLTADDVNYYAAKFKKSGFTGGLNYYRAYDLTWEMSAAWTGDQIKVPVKFMVGDLDITYNFPGTQDYIHKGGFKKDVPEYLQEVVIVKDAAHFVNQEKPDEINAHIYDFIRKF